MSTLPLLLSLANELESWDRPGDEFGLGMYPYQFHQHRRPTAAVRFGAHPLDSLIRRRQPGGLWQGGDEKAVSSVGKDGFQVSMDVQQFKPSELTVKTVDNSVVVEGKHEERADEHGFISRQFVRRYALPEGYDPNHALSTLSSDGVLTVKIPPPPKKSDKSNERVIQIQQTGPAHLNVKENPKEDESKKQQGKK